LRAESGADPQMLADAMAGVGSSVPTVQAGTGLVVLPVRDGAAVLPAVAARLAQGGLRVAELALRRPTLDDVFLTLTGQPIDSGSAPAEATR
jgi:hypothetical protein